jgi:uncharacterized protein (DUF4415 family)
MSKLNKKQAREIRALARMNDSKINTKDAPELAHWDRAEIGKFYRPIKKPLTIRLDADVLAWLKSQGKGYQTRLNSFLRRAMERQTGR